MKIYKKTILRFFFVVEIAIFLGVYFFGGNGLQYLNRLKNENNVIKYKVLALENEICTLEKDIRDWNTSDFYKEKVAREQLQMAKHGDIIYFVD